MKTFTGTSYFTAILIALLWIIPVTSVHAQSTERQCVDKMNAFSKSFLVFKNGYFQDDKPAENNYRYNAYGMNLYSGECAHFPHSKNTFKIYEDRLQEQIEICIKASLGPTCGQAAVNIDYPASPPATDARRQNSDSSSQQTRINNDPPPPKKPSAAERKEQQSQQLAQENQSKADSARQGKRRQHDPSAEATNCIQPLEGKKEDRVKNICDFEIYYTFCYYRPEESSFATFTTCEKQSFGAVQLKPGKSHVVYKRAEKFYWHACKLPTWSLDNEYIDGKGISARCRDAAK